jgi:hypothetical protein
MYTDKPTGKWCYLILKSGSFHTKEKGHIQIRDNRHSTVKLFRKVRQKTTVELPRNRSNGYPAIASFAVKSSPVARSEIDDVITQTLIGNCRGSIPPFQVEIKL